MSRVIILVAAGSTQCACVVSEASVLYVACALVIGAVPACATGEARGGSARENRGTARLSVFLAVDY